MKTHRLLLLSTVAPFAFTWVATAAEIDLQTDPPIILAQAGSVDAARAEVAAAQAALQEAQASGGDVAAAQARLEAALNDLAQAEASESAPAEPEAPPPESEAEPQEEEPPAGEPEEPPAPELPPPPQTTPEPQEPEAPPAVEPPPSEEPPPAEEPPATEPPLEEPPQTDQPAIDEPAPDAPPPAPEPPTSEPSAAGEPPVPPSQEAPELETPEPPAAPDETPRDQPGEPSAEPAPPATPPDGEPPVLAPPAGEQGATTPTPEATPDDSIVEMQLQTQGDAEEIKTLRTLREKLRREQDFGERSDEQTRDRDMQRGDRDRDRDRGERDDRDRTSDRRDRDRDRDGWDRDRGDGSDIVLDLGGRFVVRLGDQLVVRQDRYHDSDRFLPRARDVDVEHFPGGYTRTTVTRRDNSQVITVRDRYGEIVTRTRVDDRGRQVILIDNRDFYREGPPRRYVRFEDELPPLRIDIPREQYIVETSRIRDPRLIREALLAPPVERVERRYSLEEIRTSKRIRDKVRRVDLNTITFDFGSAAISPSQFESLSVLGETLEDLLRENPDELFLIEGHTDAVGSDPDNLILSDRRAEAVAVVLSSNFEIPPENLITQGYGEQYLKVQTEAAERENRRVTIRNITELAHGG